MCVSLCRFFFNDTATTEIYTLALHDALPIYRRVAFRVGFFVAGFAALHLSRPLASVNSVVLRRPPPRRCRATPPPTVRLGEDTSELQSRQYLALRLLLAKKNTSLTYDTTTPS